VLNKQVISRTTSRTINHVTDTTPRHFLWIYTKWRVGVRDFIQPSSKEKPCSSKPTASTKRNEPYQTLPIFAEIRPIFSPPGFTTDVWWPHVSVLLSFPLPQFRLCLRVSSLSSSQFGKSLTAETALECYEEFARVKAINEKSNIGNLLRPIKAGQITNIPPASRLLVHSTFIRRLRSRAGETWTGNSWKEFLRHMINKRCVSRSQRSRVTRVIIISTL